MRIARGGTRSRDPFLSFRPLAPRVSPLLRWEESLKSSMDKRVSSKLARLLIDRSWNRDV